MLLRRGGLPPRRKMQQTGQFNVPYLHRPSPKFLVGQAGKSLSVGFFLALRLAQPRTVQHTNARTNQLVPNSLSLEWHCSAPSAQEPRSQRLASACSLSDGITNLSVVRPGDMIKSDFLYLLPRSMRAQNTATPSQESEVKSKIMPFTQQQSASTDSLGCSRAIRWSKDLLSLSGAGLALT